MRKRIFIAALCVVVLAVMATTTLAYYTTNWKADNVISAGKIDLDVHQVTAAGDDSPSFTNIQPGDTVDKIVTVENTGDHPCFVRVKVENRLSGENTNIDNCISINYNTTDWTYAADGFYYYNKSLNPNETTENLFSMIYFVGTEMGNEFLTKTLEVEITAYAVQSENNGTEPVKASGWSKINN